MEAYEMYPNDIDDIAEVVNHYTAIMENNNDLTEREKMIIYGALTVSLYSPQLWNNFE